PKASTPRTHIPLLQFYRALPSHSHPLSPALSDPIPSSPTHYVPQPNNSCVPVPPEATTYTNNDKSKHCWQRNIQRLALWCRPRLILNYRWRCPNSHSRAWQLLPTCCG